MSIADSSSVPAHDRELDLLVVPVQDGRLLGHRSSSCRSVASIGSLDRCPHLPMPGFVARASAPVVDSRRRFCGPPDRGNGGHHRGDARRRTSTARPRSRCGGRHRWRPRCTVRSSAATASCLRDGDDVVAEGPVHGDVDVEARAPLSVAAAHRCRRGASPVVVHPDWHPFPTLLRVRTGPRGRATDCACFPGRVGSRPLFAAPVGTRPIWPAARAKCRPSSLWAALDCPSSFVMYIDGDAPDDGVRARADRGAHRPATGDRRDARRAVVAARARRPQAVRGERALRRTTSSSPSPAPLGSASDETAGSPHGLRPLRRSGRAARRRARAARRPRVARAGARPHRDRRRVRRARSGPRWSSRAGSASRCPKPRAGSGSARSRSRSSPRSSAAHAAPAPFVPDRARARRVPRGGRRPHGSTGCSPATRSRASRGIRRAAGAVRALGRRRGRAAPPTACTRWSSPTRPPRQPAMDLTRELGWLDVRRPAPASRSAAPTRATGCSTAARPSRRPTCSAARRARSTWRSSTRRTACSSAGRSGRSRR